MTEPSVMPAWAGFLCNLSAVRNLLESQYGYLTVGIRQAI